jgi:hypothetical protein
MRANEIEWSREDILMAKIVVACVIVLVLSIGSCTSYEVYSDNASVVEMVKAGSDPLAARCAVSPGDTVCSAVAAKQ